MKLFLSGDVMTGRGIDQILPHPSEPGIYEPLLASAEAYVELAERASGPILRPVDFGYIWGDVLQDLSMRAPDLRLVNLETSVTTNDEPLPKGINYRMHPLNLPCLLAAGIDCCVLANNHVLDWGVPGLLETLNSLSGAGIAAAGAGKTLEEAARPAVLAIEGGSRVLVFGLGSTTSGIPSDWAARETRPGVHLLPALSEEAAERLIAHIRGLKQPGGLIVISLHWGENWGYTIPTAQRRFARQLIDAGVADVVHGHSSHHIKGIEVYREHLILYGCGDFISDYEGIGGHETYRPELVLAYFASLDDRSGRLERLEMVPYHSQRLRLLRVRGETAAWIQRALNRESKGFGATAELTDDDVLELRW